MNIFPFFTFQLPEMFPEVFGWPTMLVFWLRVYFPDRVIFTKENLRLYSTARYSMALESRSLSVQPPLTLSLPIKSSYKLHPTAHALVPQNLF